MPISVVQVASIIDGEIIFPDRPRVPPSNLLGFLTALGPHPSGDGPNLSIVVAISDAPTIQSIPMSLERFLSAAEVKQSRGEPLSLVALQAAQQHLSAIEKEEDRQRFIREGERLWLFRDDFYAAVRSPRRSEIEEIPIRIKALHFQSADNLKRLKELVANFEAVEVLSKNTASRRPLPDDVKLLVWARDGGACVRCGATTDLHFDHVIPLSRGGGDHAENIQLLCRTCNLMKSNRLG